VCAAALGLALASCSDDSSGETSASATPTATTTAEARYNTPLKGVCPDKVIVQTNWWPEPDHGGTYQLLGSNPTIDAAKNRVTGPLGGTGVQLEIRAGGPALGFQQVSSLLAQDDDILLGYVGTDEAVENSGGHPSVAVFSTYEKNPQVWIWGNPEWDYKNTADIGKSGVTVQVFDGASYLEVFKREGLLKESQLDTSYHGTPERFVAEDGKIVIQGFVTNEPYALEHDVKQWAKPVKYLLVEEYPVYQSALSVRADKLDANKACLEKLVPLFQAAQRDYVADPGPTNKFLLEYLGKLQTGGFTLSEGLVADASKKQKELGLIANGKDGVLGSFEDARVQTMIDRLVPVFDAKGTKPKPGLKPADLVTNEFLDKSISLK
jgi:hypothetical protein